MSDISSESAILCEPLPPPPPPRETRGGVWSPSFLALVATQFTVALNDNIFRWLIIPIGKDIAGPDTARTLGALVFLVPFLVFAAPAGYFSDRYSKRSVMIGCKLAEIAVMALGMAAILSGNIWFMMVVLFLMGAQSTFFSPSKYGSIPEMVRPQSISAANGIIGMTTMAAIILGAVIGGWLYSWTTVADPKLAASLGLGPGQHHWWISAAVLLGVATSGWLVSLLIGRLPVGNPASRFPVNPAAQTARDLHALISRRPLILAALGSTYFWSLGALAQLNIDKLAVPELVGAGPEGQPWVGPLLAVLTLGIGLGSLLAGVLSRGRIELGLVSFGAAGIAVMSIVLWTLPPGNGSPMSAPYFWTGMTLSGLGMAAGLYDIPLLSFLQDRSPKESRGRILAAYNFLAFSGMLLASGLFGVLTGLLGLSARQIFLVAGLVTVLACVLIVYLVPIPTIRVMVRLLAWLLYRVRVEGMENVPKEGGALVVSNHVSWLDGPLLLLVVPRPLRMIAHSDYVSGGLLGRLSRDAGVIPIRPGRKSMVASIRAAREALRQGDLVGIFPEGGLSRTGQLRAFRPGFLSVIKDTGAPVVPVYIDGLWGSIFTFERGRFFWKWPRRLPYRVTIHFGAPIAHPADGFQVRRAVQELGVRAVEKRQPRTLTPPRGLLRNMRRSLFRVRAADSTGLELTGAGLLSRMLILRRLLRRRVLEADEPYVGVLLPPSVAGLVANGAAALDRRMAVNLNYTVSSEVMNHCIGQCGMRHVLTSRKMMERVNLPLNAELVYLEDLKDKVTLADKLVAGLHTWVLPAWVLERWLGLTRTRPDDVLTVIFTSGSTGRPKGVMLTHGNVGSNVEAFNQVLHLGKRDVLCGILPFFHSFGYTTTLWAAMKLEPKVAYHFNPLEPRQVGALCRKHGATLLVATPTFLRSYLRRCEPEDFAALEMVITGAEKLPPELADAFQQKFGVRPLEGYGTTELSPVVSANIPPQRVSDAWHKGCKEGTVGQPMPGIAVKVVDLDTGADLGPGKSGMLLVKGPNVMKGYLHQPDLTAEVLRDGWYVTGDIAQIDNEGFIRITGRQSRFSKIGGEMVPHLRVEEVLSEVLSLNEDEPVRLAVTAVPDAKKGERLVVLHTGLDRTSEQLCRELAAAGLPPLWIPSPDSFCRVERIPVLGTGKLDLKRLKDLALERFAGREGE